MGIERQQEVGIQLASCHRAVLDLAVETDRLRRNAQMLRDPG